MGMSCFFLASTPALSFSGHGGLFSLLMPRFSLTLALILLFSGHGDPFLLHMPRFSLTPALTLFSSGHGGLFLLHMPRFSLTLALTLLFSGHDNSFHSPMPLTLFSPQKKIRSINLSIITLFLLTCATLQVSSVRVSTSLRRMLLEKSF